LDDRQMIHYVCISAKSMPSLQSDVLLKAYIGKLICYCKTSSYDFGQNS